MSELLVFSTARDVEEAEKLAKLAVEKRLAACVNMIPKVRSIYRWLGEIQDESEVLCVIKTTSKKYSKLKEFWIETHSYEVPEFIAFKIKEGLDSYLKWIVEQCK